MRDSDGIPYALHHAHSELIAWLEKPIEDWEPVEEICNRIERFVDAIRENPAWFDELVRRATLVESLCRKGTSYEVSRNKVVAPRLKISRILGIDDALWWYERAEKAKQAQEAKEAKEAREAKEVLPTEELVVPHTAGLELALNCLLEPILPLIRSIREQRRNLKSLIDAPNGIGVNRDDLECWHEACEDIDAQVSKPRVDLHVDGCRVLMEISEGRHVSASDSEKGWRAVAISAGGRSDHTVFGFWISEVKAAADSMVDFSRRHPLAEDNRIQHVTGETTGESGDEREPAPLDDGNAAQTSGAESDPMGSPGGVEAARQKCDELAKQFLPFEPGNADWISNKVAANILGISVKRLTNMRHEGVKCERGSERYGLHDEGLFWRTTGKEPPKYYLPHMKQHAGHLAKIYPKIDRKRLQ